MISVYNQPMNNRKLCLSFLIVLIFSLVPLFGKPKASKPYYISVEEISAKTKPSFFGKAKDTFFYGDVVFIVNQKGSWVEVEGQASKKSGWIKDSVVTTKKIVAKNRVSVDASEIALAGKGFSSPLEAEYSKSYNIDFDVVDKVENLSISLDEIEKFIEEGKLRGEE